MIFFLKRLFIGTVLNVIAILACQKILNYLFNDFFFQGSIKDLVILALVLTLLNFLIKPILKIIFLPLIWLTLGLFSIVINLVILKGATVLIPGLAINSIITWVSASIIISFFNSFLNHVVK
ncbi:MAG: phage holin family protein [Candidatus Paceibacterota bacterium]|jgi:putative membrane protein|nr:phage holin family protein [Candidatus Paceibacterota bacterium]MDD3548601.1 phage holin family protein [Candidatus Paceibacterota bacterium]MDD4999016.1 phage holin family protein [Candidatus Paceibacterota bacterium]MDD5545136.1 phage holin family protein [Candidatus Paceibacterota bacterium]